MEKHNRSSQRFVENTVSVSIRNMPSFFVGMWDLGEIKIAIRNFLINRKVPTREEFRKRR